MVAAWIRAETGRRAFHGVRQPGVQEELGRLAHGADEQEQAGDVERAPFGAGEHPLRIRELAHARQDLGELDRAEHPEHGHDAQRKAEVAHAVDDEGLDGRGVRGRLVEPEADQQVGGQAHAFPAEEQLHEVGRRHQHQHGEGEERQVGEEPRPPVVLGHVPPAVEVDERRDGGHDDHHDGRERIHSHRPGGLEVAHVDERG
jgi:hypothetical protein